jgi:plastocyanin
MHSLLRLGWGAVAAVLLALTPTSARAVVTEVHVTNNQFTPEFVEIYLGDTVRWIFDEGVHSTTSYDGEWDSDLVGAGTVFEHTFQGTGQYDYYCTLHVDCCDMVGSVYVLDNSGIRPITNVQPAGPFMVIPP